MSVQRTPIPSPLAGEGGREPGAPSRLRDGAPRSERPGEGYLSPSPASLTLRARSAPSPARGEGRGEPPYRKSIRKDKSTVLARGLRSRMTDAERKLWFALRDRRFVRFKFRRQVPIGHFIADFVCFEARLIIEVDGGQHAGSIADLRRDRWFAANRFRVLRFWNNDVLSNLEGVMTLLAEALTVEASS
jgi:very-short-patch-repair endonuclease